jgi:hypothetical protein
MRVPLGWLKIPVLRIGSRLVRSTMLHHWDMLPSSVTEEYDHAGSSERYPNASETVAWNKGKLTGAKPPLRPKHVWSIWKTLQIEAALAT